MANATRKRVESMHASTVQSKKELAEKRRQEADNVREQLKEERRRKAKLEEESRQNRQAQHDEIHTWSIFSFSEPTD